jgi:hypothetical protein
MVWCRYQVVLMTVLPSHVGDGVVESYWRWRYRDDLTVTRCTYRVMLVTVLPSHAGDGAAEVTWSWCNVDVESCWR